jgi:hypothetical protein
MDIFEGSRVPEFQVSNDLQFAAFDFLAVARISSGLRFFTIWSVSKLTKFLPCCTMKPLAWLAPTILSKLHDEVKARDGDAELTSHT